MRILEVEPDVFAALDKVLADPARVATAKATCRERLAALALEVRQELHILTVLGMSADDAVQEWRAISNGPRVETRYEVELRLKEDHDA